MITSSVNQIKQEFMCFKRDGAFPTLCGVPVKLIDQFTYLGRNISSTESGVNIRIKKAQTAVHRLSIKCIGTRGISDLSDKIKGEFFQAIAVSVLLLWLHLLDLNKMTGEKVRWEL